MNHTITRVFLKRLSTLMLAAGGSLYIFIQFIHPLDSSVQSAFDSFKKSNAGTVNFADAPFYGEYSIGYAF